MTEIKRLWSNPITFKGTQTGVSVGEFATRSAARAAVPEQNQQLKESGELKDGQRVVQPREIILDTSEGIRP
jgi:hypothetical protein